MTVNHVKTRIQFAVQSGESSLRIMFRMFY
jgi:hypothetical protein